MTTRKKKRPVAGMTKKSTRTDGVRFKTTLIRVALPFAVRLRKEAKRRGISLTQLTAELDVPEGSKTNWR